MNQFEKYHPIINFVYFFAVISFSMILMHPVYIFISLFCSLLYSVLLNGNKAIKFNLLYLLPMVFITAIVNPLFNHAGITVLAYLPSGNPLTLESIYYGIAAACMIASVICWFSCLNAVISSDKLIYLFGKIVPSVSLIISMVFRFVPNFKLQIKKISDAQKCIGQDSSKGNIITKAKNGIKIMSIMITWCMENAIETADSMKSRGYGLSKRTTFTNYKLKLRDFLVLIKMVLISTVIIFGVFLKQTEFQYYPSISDGGKSPLSALIFALYFVLCALPILIELWENFKWKLLESKI